MLQTEWNWMVAVDLFLSGAGAITLAIVALLYLTRRDKHRRTIPLGAWIGTVAVGIGVLFLLADVGQQLRALNLLSSFSNIASSWMPRGAWALTLTIVLGVLFALGTSKRLHERIPALKRVSGRKGAQATLKVMAIALVPLGCFVAFYTGMLVMSSEGVPFWSTPFVPACFVCASIVAGASIANALVATGPDPDYPTVRTLALIGFVGSLALGALLWAYVGGMLSTGDMNASADTARLSAAHVTSGAAALPFWGGLVVVGTVGTALCSALAFASTHAGRLARFLPAFALAACICAVIGGFLLRWLVLSAGLHAQALVPDHYQSMDTSMFDSITYLKG